MMQRLFYVFVIVFILHPLQGYATPLFFRGLTGNYVPGSPLEFDVGLPPMSNLGSYNVDVLLASASGTAGVDFLFDVTATVPSPSDYVFPSTLNFFTAANIDSSSEHRLTLTDFDDSGVNVESGINDLVAHVVIRTTLGFSGDLSLSFNADGLILDTPDLTPTPVPGFGAIKSATEAAGVMVLTPIPEPAGLFLALVVLVFAGQITTSPRQIEANCSGRIAEV